MIIFYSSPAGHVKKIVEELDGEKVEIKIKEKVSRFFILNALKWGKASKEEKKVTILNEKFNLENLKDLTIIGPVWAGKPSNPIQTFIKENQEELNKIDNLKVIMNCAGNDGKSKEFLDRYLKNFKYEVIKNNEK